MHERSGEDLHGVNRRTSEYATGAGGPVADEDGLAGLLILR
ncbi:MAG: hypothetical protein WCG47_08990 [Dermatophilaceae bacterium]